MARSVPTSPLPPYAANKAFYDAPWDVPDIITFNCSPRFLNRPNIYPRQGTLLKVIFLQEHLFTDYDHRVIDEWERAYRDSADEKGEGNNGIVPGVRDRIRTLSTCPCGHHVADHEDRFGQCSGGLCLCDRYRGRKWFREVVAVIGRRGSKGHLGGIAGAYILWHYLTKGDPQGHYGVDRDKRLTCIVFAGKKEQATTNQWRDLNNYILGAPCFHSYISRPQAEKLTVFSRHDYVKIGDQTRRGLFTDQDQASFEIVPKESTVLAGRGPASFMQVYDECLDPGTPVLTAALEWVPIGGLKPGQEVVGVDEFPATTHRRLRRAEVLDVRRTTKPALRLTFDDGSSVVCSGDHRWLRKEMGTGGTFKWAYAANLKVGHGIRRVVTPWAGPDRSYMAGYLAGFFDGEGCIIDGERKSAQASVFFTQLPGPVLDTVLTYLREMGYEPVRHNGEAYQTANPRIAQQWAIRGTEQVIRFLGEIRPVRLLERAGWAWEGRALRRGSVRSGRSMGEVVRTITAIEHLPEQELVDIETTTSTFVANGLVSHNCAHVVKGVAKSPAEDVYDAASPSLDQFGIDSFTYLPSSPWQRIGLLYDKYQNAIEVNEDGTPAYPELLMVQLTSWDLYKDWEIAHTIPRMPPEHLLDPEDRQPGDDGCYQRLKGAVQAYDDNMRQLERANPETFRVERRSHFAAVLNAYLNPDRIKAIWEPYKGEVLTQRSTGTLQTTYRAHGDPSKSGAGFGFAVGHVDGHDERGLPHVVFDRIHGWNPADFEGHEIDYDLIGREIATDVLDVFMPAELTFDQFNCLDGQTLIPTREGLLTISEVVGETVGEVCPLSVDVQSKDVVATANVGVRKGPLPTLRFTTKHGVPIICTPEHRLWVRKAKDRAWHPDEPWQWLTAAEIEPGDHFRLRLGSVGSQKKVSLASLVPAGSKTSRHHGVSLHSEGKWVANGTHDGRQVYLGIFDTEDGAAQRAAEWYAGHPTAHSRFTYPETLDEPLARYLGLLVSEGNVEKDSARVGNKDVEVLEAMVEDLGVTFGNRPSYTYDTAFKGRYSYGSVQVGPKITRFLKALGAEDVNSRYKVVPWSVRRSPVEVQAAFLTGLFEGDGGITVHPTAGEWVHFTTTSERLGIEVQQILHAMGILTTRWEGFYDYKDERRRQWRVKVSGPDLLTFRKQVGFLSSTKRARLDQACAALEARGDRVGRRDRNVRGEDWYFDRIVKVEDGGIRDCYDISVPGPESFVANGIVCHNSVATIQFLQRHARAKKYPKRVSIYERPATGPLNWKTYETFKTALGLGLIHGPYHELAELELTYLQDLGGKVEHPTSGPVQTKDIADCYSSSMEVLTERGWMLFKDVPRGVRVATRSPEGRLEYQEPTDYIARHYTGPMYEYDSHQINFSVTPKHRMLTLDANGRPRFIHAEDLTSRQYRIPKTAMVEDRTPNTISFDADDLSASRRRVQGRGGDRKDSGWTEEQDEYLRQHYATASMTDLCGVLGKTRGAIYNRAKPRNLNLIRGQIGDRIGDRPTPLPETKVEDFAAFLGIWLAEGRKMRDRPGYDVRITQTKPEAVEWIDQMFYRLPWPVHRSVQANGETVWTVKSHGLREYLRACQGEGHELLIPDEVFSTWTRREMEKLLEGLLVGDGCWGSRVDRHVGYYSTSKRLVDDVQRVLAHLGMSGYARIVQRKSQYRANHDLWYVSVNISQASTLHTDRLRKIDYDGMVYCLTVPNSTLLVRRNGVPMWSGNCLAIVTYELIGEQMSAFIGKMLSDVPVMASAQGGFDPYTPQHEEAHESLSSFGRGRQYGQGAARGRGPRRR